MQTENTIKVAQIGAGSFGKKRAESIQQCERAELLAIADANSETAAKAAEALSSCRRRGSPSGSCGRPS